MLAYFLSPSHLGGEHVPQRFNPHGKLGVDLNSIEPAPAVARRQGRTEAAARERSEWRTGPSKRARQGIHINPRVFLSPSLRPSFLPPALSLADKQERRVKLPFFHPSPLFLSGKTVSGLLAHLGASAVGPLHLLHNLNLELLDLLPVRLGESLLVRREAQVAPREKSIQQLAEFF